MKTLNDFLKNIIPIIAIFSIGIGTLVEIIFLSNINALMFFNWSNVINNFIVCFSISSILGFLSFFLYLYSTNKYKIYVYAIISSILIFSMSFSQDYLGRYFQTGFWIFTSMYAFFLIYDMRDYLYQIIKGFFNKNVKIYEKIMVVFILLWIFPLMLHSSQKIIENTKNIYNFDVVFNGVVLEGYYYNGEYVFVKGRKGDVVELLNNQYIVLPVSNIEGFVTKDK